MNKKYRYDDINVIMNKKYRYDDINVIIYAGSSEDKLFPAVL